MSLTKRWIEEQIMMGNDPLHVDFVDDSDYDDVNIDE
jgi:hypothetical protein|tara:strand:+ start:952 stop:1062 length:111 start_codon:yes stop_codon:yes gene_type:complete